MGGHFSDGRLGEDTMRIYKIKSLNTRVLQIGQLQFNIMVHKFYIRLTIMRMVEKRSKWCLTLPFGFIYQIPVDRFSTNKQFKIVHPFGRWMFTKSS